MPFLFKQTRELEASVDDFLNAISESLLAFKQAIKEYLRGDSKGFEVRIREVDELENKADTLRRMIENRLYSHSLIPEHRGDVLGLLENLDDIIDRAKKTLLQLDVEKPDIVDELHEEFMDLAKVSVLGAEEVIKASRDFFRDVNAVKDHLHKVNYYEKEADRIAEKLTRHIFELKIDLSRKTHMRYFVNGIVYISDEAEDVADRLAIYTIKRTL